MAPEIMTSPHPDVQIPDVSLHELVMGDAGRHADAPALVDGPSGRTLTYGQLAGGVRRVAAGLAARGFAKGDVFAIHSPNVPEYALAFYGVSAAGGVNTTISPLYTVDELAFQLRDAGARFLLTVPPFLDRALAAASQTGVEEVFVLGEGEGATPFASLLAGGDTPPSVEIDPPPTSSPCRTRAAPRACPRGSCSPTATWSPTSPSAGRCWSRRRATG
jgi:acyl-CoA synthetase (AMP-forming)/AMP-acid ligase II